MYTLEEYLQKRFESLKTQIEKETLLLQRLTSEMEDANRRKQEAEVRYLELDILLKTDIIK